MVSTRMVYPPSSGAAGIRGGLLRFVRQNEKRPGTGGRQRHAKAPDPSWDHEHSPFVNRVAECDGEVAHGSIMAHHAGSRGAPGTSPVWDGGQAGFGS